MTSSQSQKRKKKLFCQFWRAILGSAENYIKDSSFVFQNKETELNILFRSKVTAILKID